MQFWSEPRYSPVETNIRADSLHADDLAFYNESFSMHSSEFFSVKHRVSLLLLHLKLRNYTTLQRRAP